MFVPDRPFHPSLMFESKAEAYPIEVLGSLLSLPTNIILTGKRLPGTIFTILILFVTCKWDQ